MKNEKRKNAMQNIYKKITIENKMTKLLVTFSLFALSFTFVFAQIPTLSKVRVSYRPDGGVSVTTFLKEACQNGEAETQCMDRIFNQNETLKDLPYDDLDPSQLPQDRQDRDKWRGRQGRGVWIDHSLVTKNEKIEELQAELDKELAKNNPSTVKVVKLQRLMQKVQDLESIANLIPADKLAELELDEQSLIASVVNAVSSALSSVFNGILTSIQNGFLALKQLVTDTLKVGTPEQPAGITVYDQTTKQPYCLIMRDGQLQSIPGECSSVPTTNTTSNTNTTPNTSEPAPESTPDTEPPVITLNGLSSIELEKGTQWSDPGATVTDNVNTNLGLYYQVNGTNTGNEGRDLPTIDTNVPGTSTITYTATDEAGNTSSQTRTVVVKEPTSSTTSDTTESTETASSETSSTPATQ
jgi:hypothetical protein